MRGGATFNTHGFDRVLTRRVQSLAGITVKVGIQKGATDDKGGLVAPYAAANNFGTKNAMGWDLIPARPFMTFSADRIGDWMDSQEFSRIVGMVMAGKITADQAATRIGMKAVSITRDTIRDSALYKPNTERTLEQKRKRNQGDKPLQATRSMIKAVRAVRVK